MKILIIRNSPTEINLNSYNVQELGLAKALIKKNNDVGVVFYTKNNYKEKIIDNVKIYYIPGRKIINHTIFNNVIYDICKEYDVIQTSEYNQIMSYRLAKIFPDKTVIYHGPYYRKYFLTIANNFLYDIFYLKRYLKLNPLIITKSYLAEDFLRKKGFKDVTTLGVGLNNDSIDNGNYINKEFANNFNKNNINLLCIADINKRKNIMFLLKVLNELLKEYKNYKLFLIGKPDTKYKKKCIKYIKHNQLEKYIVFIENVNQNELKDIYNRCECLLLPSTYDIFGMVLLEATYFNLPIISSLNGGSSYLFNKKDILENFDVNVWKKVIINLNKRKNKLNKKILWNDIVEDFLKVYNRKRNRK